MLEMSAHEFAELVDDAIDALPDGLLRLMDNVIVRIADRYDGDANLLGLYEGVALTERGHEYTFAVPDTITIFRKAILDICTDAGQVAHEVAVTVAHEIGHHFGIDDDRLHELGWG